MKLFFFILFCPAFSEPAVSFHPVVILVLSRISSLNDMLDVTSKPLIFDADNGGQFEHLSFLVRSLERNGVSAIIMEDKIGLKKNSLFSDQKDYIHKIKNLVRVSLVPQTLFFLHTYKNYFIYIYIYIY